MVSWGPLPGGEDARQARGANWRSHARHHRPRHCPVFCWSIRAGELLAGLREEDLPALAQEIVEKRLGAEFWPGLLLGLPDFGLLPPHSSATAAPLRCRYIPESKTSQVAKAVAQFPFDVVMWHVPSRNAAQGLLVHRVQAWGFLPDFQS